MTVSACLCFCKYYSRVWDMSADEQEVAVPPSLGREVDCDDDTAIGESSSGEDRSVSSGSEGEDGDDDSYEDESMSDSDVEDEEPLLKYRRLKSSITEILSGGGAGSAPETAACLAFHPSFMVLGTQSGALYILDRVGAERNKIVLHHARLHDISIEPTGQRIASCAEDGTVAIVPVQGAEAPLTHSYGSPVLSVQLDPEYSTKTDRMFVCGGEDSKVRVNRRGWFTSNESVLDSGEGPVHVVRWHGKLVAWASHRSVKVYDVERQKPVTRVDRPPLKIFRGDIARSCRCKLFWEDERTLLIGWGDCWMILKIIELPTPAGEKGVPLSGRIVVVHYVHSLICGIAAFGDDVCLLTCSQKAEGGSEAGSAGSTDDSSDDEGGMRRPELRVIERDGDQRCCDMLPVFGYEMCTIFDYSLESDRGIVIDDFSEKHSSNDDEGPPLPTLYIVSPKDIVVATPRTVDDHIKWALEHGQYDEALEIAEHADPPLPPVQYQMLTTRYLGNLVKERQFRRAAAMSERLLRKDREMWQYCVLTFAKEGQLREIGPYVPDWEVRLEQSSYEMILAAFLDEGDDEGFRNLIAKWSVPPDDDLIRGGGDNAPVGTAEDSFGGADDAVLSLYNMVIVIAKVKAVIGRRNSSILRETLSYLHMISGDVDNAIAQYLDFPHENPAAIVNSPLPIDIFAFIENGKFWFKLAEGEAPRVANLMKINEKKSLLLLLKAPVDVLPIHTVATQLEANDSTLLLKYLHDLFQRRKKVYNDPEYKTWHAMQVTLYTQAAIITPSTTVEHGSGAAQVDTILLQGWIHHNDVIHYRLNDESHQFVVAHDANNVLDLDHVATQFADHLSTHPGIGAVKGDGATVRVAAIPTKATLPAKPFVLDGLAINCSALLPFLKSSSLYSMDKAYKDCESRAHPLYHEMVYISTRLGNTQNALSLIIDKIGDVKQAIEFIEESHDDALWEQLIDKSLTNKKYVSGLLQDVGSTIANPAKLIRQIPDRMEVPGLRNHLAKFVSDYRLLLELQRGCNEVLKEDCTNLLSRLRWVQRAGVRVSRDAECAMTGAPFHTQQQQQHHNRGSGGDEYGTFWDVDMESGQMKIINRA